jgi:ribonuclease VapC
MSRLNSALVVDTSALMAVLLQESDAEVLLDAAVRASALYLSTATRLELSLVAESVRHAVKPSEIEQLLLSLRVELVPLDKEQMHWALQGWRIYGKGRHAASLNLGDCFCYGLAKALQVPLLFKGEDFAATDLEPALAP